MGIFVAVQRCPQVNKENILGSYYNQINGKISRAYHGFYNNCEVAFAISESHVAPAVHQMPHSLQVGPPGLGELGRVGWQGGRMHTFGLRH